MAKMPNVPFYAAHETNYTKGRRGVTVSELTVHHMAAESSTLRYLWANPSRNGSSHFGVFNGYIEQYVDTDDAAWTNSNWSANLRAITVETRGDWRNGYYNQATLDQLTEVMYWARKTYPGIKLTYHNNYSNTLCPADLKSKGYAQACWDKAGARIKLEEQTGLRVDIPDKKVVVTNPMGATLWDMNFSRWSEAKAVKRDGQDVVLPKGTVIDVAGYYDHRLSESDYYLSNYSWDKGLNQGISTADVEDFVAPPLGVPEGTDPTDNPNNPDIETTPDEGPGIQTDSEKISKILAIVTEILEFIKSIFRRK